MKNDVVLLHCARLNDIIPIVAMGLWGIADNINKSGYDVTIINTKSEELLNGSFDVNMYIDSNTKLVCFSAHWFPSLKESLILAQEIKFKYPNVQILMGGYTASFFAKIILLKYNFVDAIIRGDGEVPIVQFLNAKANVSLYDTVENLVYRDIQGNIKQNQITYLSTQESVSGIDYANFKDYLFNYNQSRQVMPFNMKYNDIANFTVLDFKGRDTFYLFTGKGCNVNCIYCGGSNESQKIINNRNKCMFVNDNQIVKTIEKAITQGYYSFYICYDPNPNNPKYVNWLEKIAEKNLDIDLIFGFWALPPIHIIDNFKAATNNLIFEITPETMSEDVRKKIRGHYFSNQQLLETINKLVEKEIYTWVYFSYPLAYESYADVVNTRYTFWELNIDFSHYVEAFYLKQSTDPASPIYNDPQKYGVVVDTYDLEIHMNQDSGHGNILIHHQEKPLKAIEELYSNIFLDNKMKKICKYTIKYLAKAFFSLKEFIDFLDNFYSTMKINSEMSECEIIQKLKVYVRSDLMTQIAHDYIYQLVDIIASQVSILNIAEPSSLSIIENETASADTLYNLILSISPTYLVGVHDYNFIEAHIFLYKQKQYLPIRRNEKQKYYAFSKIDNNIGFAEINETLHLVITTFQKNKDKTVIEILDKIAREFSDNDTEVKYIIDDLTKTVELLIKQKILILEETRHE